MGQNRRVKKRCWSRGKRELDKQKRGLKDIRCYRSSQHLSYCLFRTLWLFTHLSLWDQKLLIWCRILLPGPWGLPEQLHGGNGPKLVDSSQCLVIGSWVIAFLVQQVLSVLLRLTTDACWGVAVSEEGEGVVSAWLEVFGGQVAMDAEARKTSISCVKVTSYAPEGIGKGVHSAVGVCGYRGRLSSRRHLLRLWVCCGGAGGCCGWCDRFTGLSNWLRNRLLSGSVFRNRRK